jgi:UDP:flavonoid glycosyltransferase YjiC (YdhE family)
MCTVLYAWELGADYGHVSSFLPVAQQLRVQGHRVVLAVKDLSRIQGLAGARDFEFVQAPVWLNEVGGLAEPMVCYTDMLHRFGYLDSAGLLGIARAWQALFALLRPQLLIADHAPTALLAARGQPFRRAIYGNGFLSPPRTTPLPNMRPWLQVPAARIENSERAALQTMNDVLNQLGAAGLDNVAQLFDVDENFLMTPEELDHYSNRGAAHYYGAVLSLRGGATPPWPAVPGPKLFAYVKPRHKHFPLLLQQLRDAPYAVLMHAPGLPEQRRVALESANLRICPEPVDMRYACREAAAVVCHAGFGTVLDALLAGLPTLLLPMQLEQDLTARNVVRLGMGVASDIDAQQPDFCADLRRLFDDLGYGEQARAFARKYAGVDQTAIITAVALRCAELLSMS